MEAGGCEHQYPVSLEVNNMLHPFYIFHLGPNNTRTSVYNGTAKICCLGLILALFYGTMANKNDFGK